MILLTLLFINLGSYYAAADAGDEGDEEHCGDGNWGSNSWGLWMGIMMLCMFCGVIILIFILLYQDEAKRFIGIHPNVKENAISILDERYARGEISKGEYIQMKEDLKR